MYINIMQLLATDHQVFVLDQRNHGLSQVVGYGTRISRLSMDLRELIDHLALEKADYCGWSMGCSVLWGFIDHFGTSRIRKVVSVDEAPSIYNHADWSEGERVEAGAFTTSPERMIEIYLGNLPPNRMVVASDPMSFYNSDTTPFFENSKAFTEAVIPKPDINGLRLVMFDHITNDWRDVVRHKIDVPTAIFSGEHSDWLDNQRWMQSVIPNSRLYVYSKADHGDHFLMFKEPLKFSRDLRQFIRD